LVWDSKTLWLFIVLTIQGLIPSSKILAATTPSLELSGTVKLSPDEDDHLFIEGSLTIKDWQANRRCLVLRYNNDEYGWDHGEQRRLDSITGSGARTRYSEGETSFVLKNGLVAKYLDLHIIEILGAGDVALTYRAEVPRTSTSKPSDTFFDGFYPHPLMQCPLASEPPTPAIVNIEADITLPNKFQFAAQHGQAKVGGFTTNVRARTLAFGISQTYKRKSFQLGPLKVELFYFTDSLPNLEKTIRTSIPLVESWLGPFPHKTLTIVETSELQRQTIGGIIPLNTPRQQVFSKAQSAGSGLLNWSHWMMVKLIASQWFSAMIYPDRLRDTWLINGTRDFIVSEVLAKQPEIFDLFGSTAFISITYLQLQEYSAATFHKSHPFTPLTDMALETPQAQDVQSAITRVKQLFAMRQLSNLYGHERMKQAFKSIIDAHRQIRMSPKSFYQAIDPAMQPLLKAWWTQSGWPDFSLSDMDSQKVGDQFKTTITIEQQGAIDFPPLVMMKDEDGAHHSKRASLSRSGTWQVEFMSSSPGDSAEVDPNHETFDVDRFNNSTTWADLNFFPGSARNIADDAYTILWLPFPQRRPGEPWAMVVQGAVMKYINSGLFFDVEYAPESKKTKSKIRYRYQFPDVAIHGDLQIEQDFEGDRIAELTAVRSPLFKLDPRISLNLGLRRKERIGIENSDHMTGAFGMGIQPESNQSSCGYNLSGEIENAPERFAHDFSYERKKIRGVLSCGRKRFGLLTRVFWGKLDYQGPTPETAFFKPTEANEAALTITQGGLVWPEEILTAHSELRFPLYLPLPSDSLVLINRLRGDLFYNWGHAKNEGVEYRSGGVGMQFPFGGDLAGAGSLSLTTIRAIVVLFSKVNEVESRKPSFFVVVQGNL
jgi:hypothetical protein